MNEVHFFPEPHEYYARANKKYLLPSASEIISKAVDKGFHDHEAARRARHLGTAVHKLTELHDLDDLGEYDQRLSGYLLAWKLAKKELGIKKFDMIETPLADYDHWYATTPDRIYKDLSIDIKTGNKYKEHRLQTAAHLTAARANGIKIKCRMIIYIEREGFEADEHTNPFDIQAWEAALNIYKFKDERIFGRIAKFHHDITKVSCEQPKR